MPMLEGKSPLFEYLIYLGDNALILSHRLSEWCGHGPVLEQDIALTNIALDILGQARQWYQLAAKSDGSGLDEDRIAYLRDSHEFRNILLVEQPNQSWGNTVLRQFIYSCFITPYLEHLRGSAHAEIAAIAARSHTESLYHLRWSRDWLLRLSRGTEEGKLEMQASLDNLWDFHTEFLSPAGFENDLADQHIAPVLSEIADQCMETLQSGLVEAGLSTPALDRNLSGGKRGVHSEHLGYILAEMQYLQRSYPGLEW